MKRVLVSVAAILALLFIADWTVASIQSKSFDNRVGGSDILERLDSKVVKGATREEAERVLAGFREVKVTNNDEGYQVSYGYWFGFLPPIRGRSGLKFVGEVVIVYSTDDRVVRSSYWYN